ncbi:MAG: homoserine kinase [Bacillota bacterium]
MNCVEVKVPVTSANLGPGYDTLGMALQIYYNFKFEKNAGDKVQIDLKISGDKNYKIQDSLIRKTIKHLEDKTDNKFKGLQITEELPFLPGKGLGSSAAAIIGTLIGLSNLFELELSQAEILESAYELEGHPDNITPALYGGLNITAVGDKIYREKLHPHPDLSLILVVPDYSANTAEQRRLLPEEIRLEDITYNQSRTALMPFALASGNWEMLKELLNDKVHQPYRLAETPAWDEIVTEAIAGGAIGVVLSGAGPAILGFASENEEEIAEIIKEVWLKYNVEVNTVITGVDILGAQVTSFK